MRSIHAASVSQGCKHYRFEALTFGVKLIKKMASAKFICTDTFRHKSRMQTCLLQQQQRSEEMYKAWIPDTLCIFIYRHIYNASSLAYIHFITPPRMHLSDFAGVIGPWADEVDMCPVYKVHLISLCLHLFKATLQFSSCLGRLWRSQASFALFFLAP